MEPLEGVVVHQPVGQLTIVGNIVGICWQLETFLRPLFLKLMAGTNMTWTIRKDARWLPPKNVGGRRWYQDDAGLASLECAPFVTCALLKISCV